MPYKLGFRGSKIIKQFSKLPDDIKDLAEALMLDLEVNGPKLGAWRNFGLLAGTEKGRKVYHAHLNTRKPRYVAVWELVDDNEIEILFFGTHEKVNYKRL